MSLPPTDPALTLTWLVRTRRGSIALELMLLILAEAGTSWHVHSLPLIGALAAWTAIDIAQAIASRGRVLPVWLVPAHGALDLTALTVVLAMSGGALNPLVAAYLVYVALLAVVLLPAAAWSFTAAAIGLQGLAVLRPSELHGFDPHPMPLGHTAGHVLAFGLAAVAITWVVNRVSRELRTREASALDTQRQLSNAQRLASLGALAAGVAHELGTPLGTIQLLAEERAQDPEHAARMVELVAEVERCRAILDRLRSNEPHGAAGCVADVRGWVAEWRRSAPEIEVLLTVGADGLQVAGAEGNWRSALWVALDNARRAGARTVTVDTRVEGGDLVLEVRDDGRGLDEQAMSRGGEPFHSTWGGTGLGLFVARTFAASVGGDVVLRPGPDRGAEVQIRMPVGDR